MTVTYGYVLIDVDMGIGRQYGYSHPRTAVRVEECRPLPHGGHPARCHPDRIMHALGKCERCYKRDWRLKRKATTR